MKYVIVVNPYGSELQLLSRTRGTQFFRWMDGKSGEFGTVDSIRAAFSFSSAAAAETTATLVHGSVFELTHIGDGEWSVPRWVAGLPHNGEVV